MVFVSYIRQQGRFQLFPVSFPSPSSLRVLHSPLAFYPLIFLWSSFLLHDYDVVPRWCSWSSYLTVVVLLVSCLNGDEEYFTWGFLKQGFMV